MTTVTEAGAQAGRWCPLKAAAGELGISADAVRRRVASGLLRAERRRTARGVRVFVWLPAGGAPELLDDAAPAGAPDASPQPGEAGHSGTAPRAGEDVARGGAHVARGGAESRDAAPPGAELVATARAREMAEYTERLLAPWRQRVEELAAQVGRLEAELEQARARGQERRRWWRWWG